MRLLEHGNMKKNLNIHMEPLISMSNGTLKVRKKKSLTLKSYLIKRKISWELHMIHSQSQWSNWDKIMPMKKKRTKRENKKPDLHKRDLKKKRPDWDTSNNNKLPNKSKIPLNLKFISRQWILVSIQEKKISTHQCLCSLFIIKSLWTTLSFTLLFRKESSKKKRTLWFPSKVSSISWKLCC